MNCIVSLSQLRQISVTCKRESRDSYTHLSRYNSITSHLKEVCPEGPQGFSLLLSPLSISFYPLLLFFSFLRVSCNTPTRCQAFLKIFLLCQAHSRYPNQTICPESKCSVVMRWLKCKKVHNPAPSTGMWWELSKRLS